jgi:DnaJ-class molecular chaperone
VLGLDGAADQAEIKAAFRDLAKKHHPDANPGDEAAAERFKSVIAAYELLKA